MDEGVGRGREARRVKTWRDAWWLAERDARRAWLSFPATALLAVALGLFTGVLTSDVFHARAEHDAIFPSLLLDFYFMGVAGLFLTLNALFNKDYSAYWRRDYLSKRLFFLRSLPIGVRELVLSRVIIMLLTLVVTAPCFFLPLYLVSADPAFGSDPVRYAWFVALWLGYALFAGGANMYAWLGTDGRTNLWVALIVMALLALVIGLSNAAFGVGIVVGTMGLVRAYGPLPAVLALLAGLGTLFLWALAMERRLERRDLSA